MTSEKQRSSVHEHVLFLVLIGAMSAISVVLAYLFHFPLIPAAPFLEYDPADIVIYLCTYLMGVPYGLVLTGIVSVVQGITVSAQSGVIGILMHIFSTGSFVLTAGFLFRGKRHSGTGAEEHGKPSGRKRVVRIVLATLCGIAVVTVLMVLWNVLLTPIYMKVDRMEIVRDLLSIYVPFNLLKATINGVLSAILFFPVQRAMAQVWHVSGKGGTAGSSGDLKR